MSTTTAPTQRTSDPLEPRVARAAEPPWAAIVVIAVAQLMIALDATVVNIALPSAQQAARVRRRGPAVGHHGVHPTFAGLLLLGGRVADLVGRRTPSSAGSSVSRPPRRSPARRRTSRCWPPAGPCKAPAPPSSRRPRCRWWP